ncbi:MAG: hypothetical protein ACP5TZ_05290 [Nitrososphaeria archaeon]
MKLFLEINHAEQLAEDRGTVILTGMHEGRFAACRSFKQMLEPTW